MACPLPVREAPGRPVWGRRSCLGCRAHGGRGQGAKYPKADQRRRTRGRWRPTLQKQKRSDHRPIYFTINVRHVQGTFTPALCSLGNQMYTSHSKCPVTSLITLVWQHGSGSLSFCLIYDHLIADHLL